MNHHALLRGVVASLDMVGDEATNVIDLAEKHSKSAQIEEKNKQQAQPLQSTEAEEQQHKQVFVAGSAGAAQGGGVQSDEAVGAAQGGALQSDEAAGGAQGGAGAGAAQGGAGAATGSGDAEELWRPTLHVHKACSFCCESNELTLRACSVGLARMCVSAALGSGAPAHAHHMCMTASVADYDVLESALEARGVGANQAVCAWCASTLVNELPELHWGPHGPPKVLREKPS